MRSQTNPTRKWPKAATRKAGDARDARSRDERLAALQRLSKSAAGPRPHG
jgi:hypothetical protein